MAGWPTPEDAAMESMPRGITHVVETRHNAAGDEAYVLLAIKAWPPGCYLDANVCERDPDGGWTPVRERGRRLQRPAARGGARQPAGARDRSPPLGGA